MCGPLLDRRDSIAVKGDDVFDFIFTHHRSETVQARRRRLIQEALRDAISTQYYAHLAMRAHEQDDIQTCEDALRNAQRLNRRVKSTVRKAIESKVTTRVTVRP